MFVKNWYSVILLCVLGCGDSETAPKNFAGKFELFYDVNVSDFQCQDGQISATVELKASNLASETPSSVGIYYWEVDGPSFDLMGNMTLTPDTSVDLNYDLPMLGSCEASLASIAFVPFGPKSYGEPSFMTLNRGNATGAMSQYDLETKITTLKFYCADAAINSATATVYNFQSGLADRIIDLGVSSEADSLTGSEPWLGTTTALRPSEEVVIFEGYTDEGLACFYIL